MLLLLTVVDTPSQVSLEHLEMDSEISDDKNLSTRVNAARLPEYIGRHVRLACKVLKVRVLPPLPSVLELNSLLPVVTGHLLDERKSCHGTSI